MATPLHPYGVQPLGNFLNSNQSPTTRSSSLGHFAILSDSLIIRILDALINISQPNLAAISLSHFSAVSTYTRAFASDEDLWRNLVWRTFTPSQIANAPFRHSWRYTYISLLSKSPTTYSKPIISNVVYSDVLFHKWRCLRSQIAPEWTLHDDIKRIDGLNLSPEQFRTEFEQPRIPVVIKGLASKWPASSLWYPSSMIERSQNTIFHAGGFELSLQDYFSYCQAIEGFDDQPLYIFDKKFAEKAPCLLQDYQVPPYFSEDLFKVLDDNRPYFRWLIIGPARSGSSFHKDPNATSAWNAVIRGRKKWLLFPPDCPPPGVFPSGDEGDVTAPVSITEWFLNFYNRETVIQNGAMECIVEEGEIMFVPMGWWHCVLNLETSIAITQNYVGWTNARDVTNWVRTRPSQISGCRDKDQAKFISNNFQNLLVEQFPGKAALEGIKPLLAKTKGENSITKKYKPSLWESLNTNKNKKCKRTEDVHDSRAESKPFTFGF